MAHRFTVVHPICTHYTRGLFEELSRRYDMQFLFFSEGGEWFWQKEHGVQHGEFPHEYLAGFRVGGLRISPSLPWKLLRTPSDAIVSSIDGKFALSVTYLAARWKCVPFLLWTGMWSRGNRLLDRLTHPITRFFYRHADAVLVYGEHVKRYLVSEGVSPERIFIARHSVDNEYYARQVEQEEQSALRERLGIPADKKIILFLGRLEQVKGVRYLIEAFAHLSRMDAVLLIAGEGSQRAALKALATTLCPPGKVFFSGYVPVAEAVPYFRVAQVCVIPSIAVAAGKELWGLVANEAFNQGVPVIATDSVGAAAGGFIQNGVNGFVVPEGDSTNLALAIRNVLENSALQEKLSAGARETVVNWTHARMADGFTEAFEFVSYKKSARGRNPNAAATARGIGCPLCRNELPFTRAHGAFRRCPDCGLLFRCPMPELQELQALYGQSWIAPGENQAETGGTSRVLAEEYSKRLACSLGRADLKGLKILEYGAGRGEFLRALERSGAEVYALEPYGKNYLEQEGIRAYASFDELPANLQFDGIVSIDVVEHELAPWTVLRRLKTFLKRGGWLYLATPNPAGLNARVLGPRWREARKPGHLLFFEPKTLSLVLQAAGFARSQRLRWNVSYGKSPLTRLKDSILSLVGLDGELRFLAFCPDEKPS
jgi:glycosyltransferase involved in cell wall biosynthesis/2-polyprenyl-3-methyl-5-hydroxy-6-metoxy-1,4-benzoquinol methylase